MTQEETSTGIVARGKLDMMRELKVYLKTQGIEAEVVRPPEERGGCGSG